MSYIDAVAYIKRQRGVSISDDATKQSLKNAGWHDADINQAFFMLDHDNATKGSTGVSDEMKNPYATTALVLGICGFLFSVFTIVPIAGVVFGILALQKPGSRKSAIWGLCLSAVGVLSGIIFWIFFSFALLSGYFGHSPYPSYDDYNYSGTPASYDNIYDPGLSAGSGGGQE